MNALGAPDGFVFDPNRLGSPRRPGISGFMRVRNGEDWLEAAVSSHLDYLDEVVAVYNDCTDRTPEILGRIAGGSSGKDQGCPLPAAVPPGWE